LAFLLKLLLVFGKHCDHNISFWEKRQFFRRKLSKIAENWNHNIDPWLADLTHPILAHKLSCVSTECNNWRLELDLIWSELKINGRSQHQRPILNFTPRGEFCPPGANFVPWVWSYPLGVKLSVCPSILLNYREYSPLGLNGGVNIPLGDQFHPWGPGAKLRMALCSFLTGMWGQGSTPGLPPRSKPTRSRLLTWSSPTSPVPKEQGDQIGRIFAYWAIVCFRQFLKYVQKYHIILLYFFPWWMLHIS
jgi:hypothetical protein